MFPRYLQYLLTDFRQTFVAGASRDTDDLITFLGQKVKVQGHTIAAEAHSTRRYGPVQLFLVFRLIIDAFFENYIVTTCAEGAQRYAFLILRYSKATEIAMRALENSNFALLYNTQAQATQCHKFTQTAV